MASDATVRTLNTSRTVDNGFESASQLAARQHHTATTSQAFEADISAKAGNLPFVAVAGMRLSQTDDVIQMQFGEHGALYHAGSLKYPNGIIALKGICRCSLMV